MFSPVCFTNFFNKFWAFEKESELVIGPKQAFFQFASWKRNHNKDSLKKFVDSEFEIGKNLSKTLETSRILNNKFCHYKSLLRQVVVKAIANLQEKNKYYTN